MGVDYQKVLDERRQVGLDRRNFFNLMSPFCEGHTRAKPVDWLISNAFVESSRSPEEITKTLEYFSGTNEEYFEHHFRKNLVGHYYVRHNHDWKEHYDAKLASRS